MKHMGKADFFQMIYYKILFQIEVNVFVVEKSNDLF